MNWRKAVELEEQGNELLKKRDFHGAEKKFARALEFTEEISFYNNMAFSVFLQGESKRAWQIIEPYLNPDHSEPQPNPFTHALAAQLLAALGDEVKARHQLKMAIGLFEKDIAELQRQKVDITGWGEYTITIMKAAAALNDDRQVFQLYRRWEKHHVTWENRYLAGIASFNQGYYTRAASLWSSLKTAGEFVLDMQQVAILVDRGVVPAFRLEYENRPYEELRQEIKEAVRDREAKARLLQSGTVRMMLLSLLLDPEIDEKAIRYSLALLIPSGGEWGRELGFALLQTAGIPSRIKLPAAYCLLDCGALPENEPITIVLDGEEKTIELKKFAVAHELDQETVEKLAEAKMLQEKGRIEEAIDLLDEYMHKGSFHLNVALTLANLYNLSGNPEKAITLLNILEEMLPGNPTILFNLASLWLQQGDLPKARSYLEGIDLRGGSKELKEKFKLLKKRIELTENIILPKDIEEILSEVEEKRRKEIETKTLPLDATLARGLKNMPVNWINGMVDDYDLEPHSLRKEREKEIVRFLCQPHNLKAILQEDLDDDELQLLHYLLERGGWARLNAVTRRFGTLDGDGFYWEDYLPDSPLGFLWSRGLVAVGSANLNGRKTRFATVPRELREPLASILKAAPSG